MVELEKEKLQHDYACKALEAQKVIHATRPEQAIRFVRLFSFIAIIIIIILLVFFAFCIHYGKEEIVLSIIKYLGVGTLSFFSGMLYGKKRKNPSNEDSIMAEND